MNKLAFIISLILLTVLTACNTGEKKERIILTNITGELNDVLVVMKDVNWKNNTGKALKNILQKDCYALPQYESIFKTIQIKPSDFTNMFQLYRNIIDVKISSQIKKSKIWYGKNVFSKPQSYIKIEAKNSHDFIKIINKNSGKIKDFFRNAEIKRLQDSYTNRFSVDIMKKNKKKFNIKIDIPANYQSETDTTSFSWVSFETPEMSQGIFIYSYPYQDTAQFNAKNIIKMRDLFLKKFVPGPRKNSYMHTEPEFPVRRSVNIDENNFYSVFIEGLWRVEGDFMGGPFISYSFPNKENTKIICVDAYVYCPRKDKRNFMMQLEAIIKTAEYNN